VIKTETKTIKSNLQKLYHNWYSKEDYRQSYIDYARKISNWNKNFIATLNEENWLRDPYRQSNVIDKYWKREPSFWFCQLHTRRHSKVVDDPRFRSDPYRQLDRCREKYSGWTKMYWRNHRKNSYKFFNF